MLYKKFKIEWMKVCIISGLIIFTALNSIRIDKVNKSLQDQLIETNIKLQEANNKIEELQENIGNWKELENGEFRHVWESLRRIRNNFLSLGLGYHLEDKDLCPKSECEEEYNVLNQAGNRTELFDN